MNLRLIGGLVLIVALGGAGYKLYGLGYAAAEAQHAAATIEAQRVAAEKQKALIVGVQKVAEDHDAEQADLQTRLVGANAAAAGLRLEVARANSAGADSATTAVADAQTARSLLADCADRYRDVAEHADRLRATVLGLQAYARTVTTP